MLKLCLTWHALQAKLVHSLILNGCVFLGSVAWWITVLQPLVHYLIAAHVAPLAGSPAAGALESLLHSLYHVFWLIPVYVVTLGVSCSWCANVTKLDQASVPLLLGINVCVDTCVCVYVHVRAQVRTYIDMALQAAPQIKCCLF